MPVRWEWKVLLDFSMLLGMALSLWQLNSLLGIQFKTPWRAFKITVVV
jgi:hypothetical protein